MICKDCIHLREVHSDYIVCNIQQQGISKNINICSFYKKKECCNCKFHNYDWNVDALKYDLERERKAFDKLHERQIELLKQQGVLEKENEELKQSYSTLKHRHSLLHDELIDVECERDSLKQDVDCLEKENKELKLQLDDANELKTIYVDFLVENGFDLADVLIGRKKELKNYE